MRLFYPSILLFLFAAKSAGAQSSAQTVALGDSWSRTVFAHAESGAVASVEPGQWDIAITAQGFSSGLRINEAEGLRLKVYRNGAAADWDAVDTSGFSTWPWQFNSDTSWATGAFNRGANPANPFDLGWGLYNIITHQVAGDSIYLLQYPDGELYQVLIQSLISGTFTLRYRELGAAASQSLALSKSSFAGRNMGYVSLREGAVRDLEPELAAWDFALTRYVAEGQQIARAGVLLNPLHSAAEARGVDPASFDPLAYEPSHWMNAIGQGWHGPESWYGALVDSLVYILHRADGSTVPIQFFALDGQSVSFGQPGAGFTSIGLEPGVPQLRFGPNPATDQVWVELGAEHWPLNWSLYDASGRRVAAGFVEGGPRAALHWPAQPAGWHLLSLQTAGGQILHTPLQIH